MTTTVPTTNLCSVDGGFPFLFYDNSGNPISGSLDANGACTFPKANCGANTPVKDCCEATPTARRTGDVYMNIAFLVIFLPLLWRKYRSRSLPEEEKMEVEERKKQMTPTWVPSRFKGLFGYGMISWIMAQILVPIFLRQSIQYELSVSDRNALIAGEAFLIPFQEIFQFIEDIVLVRVNYALSTRNKELTNKLVHFGLLTSLVMAAIAAFIGIVLGVIPQSLAALTNPGGANDSIMYPGCDLIPDDAEMRSRILPYWIITSVSTIGSYTGLVISGYMLGAMELLTVGWLGATSVALTPLIWFLDQRKSLTLLGLAQFATCWSFPILSILYMISPLGNDLAKRTGVRLQFKSCLSVALQDNTTDDDGFNNDITTVQTEEGISSIVNRSVIGKGRVDQTQDTTTAPSSVAHISHPNVSQLLMEGLKIMIMDVAIQLATTLGVYLSLITDGAQGYQIASMQSAIPAYGTAYALGMGLMVKIVGSQLYAKGKYEAFATFARITVLAAVLLVPIIVGCVLPFVWGLAFNYGSNACEFAKDDQCVPFFSNVFGPNGTGGAYTLPFTFNSFAAGASFEAVFLVLRGTLLACLDLDYMMKLTVIGMILYVPAISVAMKVFGGQAIAIFSAMYVPQAFLCVVFLIRLEIVLRRLLRNKREEGDSPSSETEIVSHSENARVDEGEHADYGGYVRRAVASISDSRV